MNRGHHPEDYRDPHRAGCERVAPTDLAPGDRVWLRHPDRWNPWFQALVIDTVTPCRDGRTVNARVSQFGTTGKVYDLTRDKWGAHRWITGSDIDAVYRIAIDDEHQADA